MKKIKLWLKKYFRILFSIIVVFCIFVSSTFVSAAGYPSVEEISANWKFRMNRIWVSSNQSLDYRTYALCEHDPFTTASYVCDFVGFYPEYASTGYHFSFDMPEKYSPHQIITVSGRFLVSSTCTSLKLHLGSFSYVELLDKTVTTRSELSPGTFYYVVNFQHTFEVSQYMLNNKFDKLFFSVNYSDQMHFFGVNNIDLKIEQNINGVITDQTNQILNGYNPPDVDYSTEDNYADIIGGNGDYKNDGIDSAYEVFNYAKDYIANESGFFKGIVFFRYFFATFQDIPFVGQLLYVSLAVGSIAFLFKLGQMAISKIPKGKG